MWFLLNTCIVEQGAVLCNCHHPIFNTVLPMLDEKEDIKKGRRLKNKKKNCFLYCVDIYVMFTHVKGFQFSFLLIIGLFVLS